MSNELATISSEQIALLQRTIAAGTTNDEFALFLAQVQRTGLDPFSRQIYIFKNKQGKLTINATIDGFRVVANRSGELDGQLGPLWCGQDGEWKDVWISTEPPYAAKVGVLRKGCKEPFWGVALYKAYVQKGQYGPIGRWENDSPGMLAKCAEALGLRKAFPQELSGLYTAEEMNQEVPVKEVGPRPDPQAPPAGKPTPDEQVEEVGKYSDPVTAGARATILYLRKKALEYKANPNKASLTKMRNLMNNTLCSLVIRPKELTASNRGFADELRRILLHEIWDVQSSEDMSAAQIGTTLTWTGIKKTEEKHENGSPIYETTDLTEKCKVQLDLIMQARTIKQTKKEAA